jgi:hypothetical protein
VNDVVVAGATGEVLERVQFVRELPRSASLAAQVLVRDRVTGQHYVVSSVVALFSGFETLVFRADAKGEVTDWLEVAGGRGVSREDAIADLDERLVEGRSMKNDDEEKDE